MMVSRIKPKRVGRRSLSLFMSLVMFVSMMPSTAFANNWEDQTGDYYVYNSDGEATGEKAKTSQKKLENGALTMEKSIVQTGENSFDITLKVSTAEELSKISVSQDAAVVLVMDYSKSMDNEELKAAKEAACNFIDEFDDKDGEDDKAKRMVSIVKFWSDIYRVADWTDISIETNRTALKNTIKDDNENGTGTNIEGGLQMAYNLLGTLDKSITNRYVILLTDGQPNKQLSENAPDKSSTVSIKGSSNITEKSGTRSAANAAAEVANEIESTYSALVYTVGFKTNGIECYKDGKQTIYVNDWLEDYVATDPEYAINTDNGEELSILLKKFSTQIKKFLQSWQVTDPMGDYINFVSLNKDNSSVTLPSNSNGQVLTWDLRSDTPTSTKTVGDKTYYTYELTYSITLDTAKQGFEEDKYYPTNKATSLKYMLGAVNQDGSVNVEAKVKTDYFNVPSVCGKIPEYNYIVEFYKQGNADAGDYENYTKVDGDTVQADPVKLHSSVSITDVEKNYKDKYSGDNYQYVKGDPVQLTISSDVNSNVIKLYYDRITTSVTVNHYYKTDSYAADGTYTEGEYTEESKISTSHTGYVGDTFTAKKVFEYNGKTYESDTGNDTIASLSANADYNVINLYYKCTDDKRADANVVVNHVYRTHTWTLKDGKYELVDTQVEVEGVESATGLKATSVYTAKTTPKDGYEDFVYNKEDSKHSKVLEAGDNTITLYFDKTIDNRGEQIQVTVNHHYTKSVTTVVDGKVITVTDPKDHVVTETFKLYKGEDINLAEKKVYNNETYTSDNSNDNKLSMTNVQDNVTVDLYYTIIEVPETTTVKVNHIYRTITHETVEITDPKSGEVTGTEVVEKITTDDTKSVTSDSLYVGQSYTATQIGRDGYTFNEIESDSLTCNADANGATVINLYYDKSVDTDDREAASINVQHKYTTHLTTVVGGEVKTIDVEDGTVTEDTHNGKAGDTFTATTKTSYNNNEYTVVGPPELKTVLQPGTNSTIVIEYERDASDLKETTYTVNYEYKTYTMFVDTDGIAKYGEPTIENAESVTGSGYVGQVITIPDGAKDGFSIEGTAPTTQPILEKDGNAWTFTYVKYVPLEQVDVTVNHHYTTTTIAVDGSSTNSTQDINGTPVKKYVGETYLAEAVCNDYTFEKYIITTGIDHTPNSNDVQLTVSGDVVVDFYYTKTVDNSVTVDYSIQHIYKTIDWDGSVTIDKPDPITGSSYATRQLYAYTSDANGVYALTEATFNGETITGFDPNDPKESYVVTLVAGENVIVYTYERTVDTRDDKDVSVTVHHKYYARDTYTTDDNLSNADWIASAGVTPEYTVEKIVTGKDNGIWIGNVYEEKEEPVYNKTTYTFVAATPESKSVKLTASGNYEITLNYIREYNTKTSYTVIHEYYTNGSIYGRITEEFNGQIGTTIALENITKQNVYNGYSYTFNANYSDNHIVLQADSSLNRITLRYYRNSNVIISNYYYRIDYVYTGYDAEGKIVYTDKVTGDVQLTNSFYHAFTADRTVSYDGHEFTLVGDANLSANLSATSFLNPYIFTVNYEFTDEPLEIPEDEDSTSEEPNQEEVDSAYEEIDQEDTIETPEDDDLLSEELSQDDSIIDNSDDVSISDVPKTGDEISIWPLITVVSAIGLVLMIISNRKSKKHTTD